MRRQLQILTVLTALAVSCGLAQAQTLNSAKIDAVNKATDSFLALAKNSHTTGQAPRYADPAVKALLDTVFDTKVIQAGKPVPWSGMEMLLQWNQAAVKIGVVYYVAGTGTTDPLEVSKDQRKIIKANSNTLAFAPEFGRYYDAQVRLHAAMIESAMAQSATASAQEKNDPKFKSTLTYISTSTSQAMVGILGTFTLEGLPEDWLLLRIVSLIEIAPKAARFMAPHDRDVVKSAAIEVAQQIRNPDAKSGVNAIARAFTLM
jgi:hypothetical protein